MMTHTVRPRRRTRSTSITAMLFFGIALTGCGTSAPELPPPAVSSPDSIDEFLTSHDLKGLDTAQIIDKLDTMDVADRPADLIASVQPNVLVLTDQQARTVELPMPDEEVYISVAPYQNQTHDCYFHSLTTCLGELANTEMHVSLVDTDGNLVFDDAVETFDNGFIGFWVPRGIEATLTVEHEGQIGTVSISTENMDDPTCITTLRLT